MNAQRAQTPASTAAPTLMAVTCVAVQVVSSEQDRGKRVQNGDYIQQIASRVTTLCVELEIICLLLSLQSLYNRLGFPRPACGG